MRRRVTCQRDGLYKYHIVTCILQIIFPLADPLIQSMTLQLFFYGEIFYMRFQWDFYRSTAFILPQIWRSNPHEMKDDLLVPQAHSIICKLVTYDEFHNMRHTFCKMVFLSLQPLLNWTSIAICWMNICTFGSIRQTWLLININLKHLNSWS